MGLLGISLIVGAFVWICFRPPAWIFLPLAGEVQNKAERDRLAMPPPPVIRRPAAPKPTLHVERKEEEQTTPKAPALERNDPVPSFSLSDDTTDFSPRAIAPGTSTLPMGPPARPSPGLMAPPPRPSLRPPSLNPVPARSAAPSRSLPVPNRGPGGSSLVPPPTHSAKPQKPSRQVVLTPGHSPLDWARLSSNPEADLRGLPSNSPYLKVTPSMLKKMTGRKGKDAWMALGGRVYNVSPYLPFHPGGEPELLRGAGRDGTKLFGEIHPWVNYEGMLSACLIGILVSEDEAGPSGGKMEEMD
ncbi:hypothetical protein GQ53DRAFT_656133 [Thozetella sp. PMI_491]|nr:hypothetical protein GQ53DRAFT_656133 [Thozetella sp. PMI_491]